MKRALTPSLAFTLQDDRFVFTVPAAKPYSQGEGSCNINKKPFHTLSSPEAVDVVPLGMAGSMISYQSVLKLFFSRSSLMSLLALVAAAGSFARLDQFSSATGNRDSCVCCHVVASSSVALPSLITSLLVTLLFTLCFYSSLSSFSFLPSVGNCLFEM